MVNEYIQEGIGFGNKLSKKDGWGIGKSLDGIGLGKEGYGLGKSIYEGWDDFFQNLECWDL